MTAGHLVARLQATLDCQIHLDHLQHARRQFVALRELLALFFERQIELVTLLFDRVLDRFELRRCFVVRQADVEPVVVIADLAR